jgi:hypothetical protein
MKVGIRGATVSLGALAALGALLASPGAASAARTYRVTITNLTTGQPLTPPVVAVHSGAYGVFRVAGRASFGVKEIAENGNNAPLLAALRRNPRVAASKQAGAKPLVPLRRVTATRMPNSVTTTLTTRPGANRLSLVSMLVCTNDGFAGVNGLVLPAGVGQSVVRHVPGYDAGTERNTQAFADLVPPCRPLITGGPMQGAGRSNPSLAEGGLIRLHQGILAGVGQMSAATYGWRNPVVRVRVTAIG